MSVQLTSEGKVRVQVRDPRHSVCQKIMWDGRFSEENVNIYTTVTSGVIVLLF